MLCRYLPRKVTPFVNGKKYTMVKKFKCQLLFLKTASVSDPLQSQYTSLWGVWAAACWLLTVHNSALFWGRSLGPPSSEMARRWCSSPRSSLQPISNEKRLSPVCKVGDSVVPCFRAPWGSNRGQALAGSTFSQLLWLTAASFTSLLFPPDSNSSINHLHKLCFKRL